MMSISVRLYLSSDPIVIAGNGTSSIVAVSIVVNTGSASFSSIVVLIKWPAKHSDTTIKVNQMNFSRKFLPSERYLNPWIEDCSK